MRHLLISLFILFSSIAYSQSVTLECYWNDTLSWNDCDVCTKPGDVEMFTGVIVQIIAAGDTSRTKIHYVYGAKIRPQDVLLFDNKGHNVFFNIDSTAYTYEEILEWFKNCHFNDLDNQFIDTFSLVGNVLRLSLSGDNQAYKSVTLTGLGDQDLSLSGSGPTYNLNITNGTGTTFTQGDGITLSRNVNDLIINAIDESPTNELDSWDLGANGSYTTISNAEQVNFVGAGTATTSRTGNTITITGVATAPAPPNTSVQWNNNGVFGGDAGFLYDAVNDVFTVTGGGIIGNNTINGAKLMVSDANRSLSGSALPTLVKLLSSSSVYSHIIHLDNNISSGGAGFSISNSGSGIYDNNWFYFVNHGASYASSYFINSLSGKSSDAGWNMIIGQGSEHQGMAFISYTNDPVVLATNNQPRIYIAGEGNVAIGNEISPSEKLHVKGNIRVEGAYYSSDNSGGTYGDFLSSYDNGTKTKWRTVDTSNTNEIQTIDQFNIINDTLRISLSGDSYVPFVNLKNYIDTAAAGYDTDSQSVKDFYINLDTLHIELTRGNKRSVYLGDLSFVAGSDKQQFDTLWIVNDTAWYSLQRDSMNAIPLNLKPYLDNTDNQYVDTFTLVGNQLRLSLSGDNNGYYYVDLTPYIQTYSHSGTTSYTNTLSGGGGSFTLNGGSGIGVSHDGSGNITLANNYIWRLDTEDEDAYPYSTINYNDLVVFTGLNGIMTYFESAGSKDVKIDGTYLQWYLQADAGPTRLIGDAFSRETVKIFGTGMVQTEITTGNTVEIFVEPVYYQHSGTTYYKNNMANEPTTWFQLNGSTGISISTSYQGASQAMVTFSVADQSATNELQNLTMTGSGPTYTIDLSNGTDVTLTQGTGITLVRTGNDLTINAAASVPQTLSGNGSNVTTLSDGGGTFAINAGTNITVTQTAGANPVYTINNTYSYGWSLDAWSDAFGARNILDGYTVLLYGENGIRVRQKSVNNTFFFDGTLLQWNITASSGTPALIGDAAASETVTIAQGAGITTSISGNVVTVTALDISATNEFQNLTWTGAGPVYNLNISDGTGVTLTQGSGITLVRTANDITISAAAGESQVLSGDGSGITSLSLSGGSFDINGGSNITVTQTAGANPVYTINNTYSYVWNLDAVDDALAAAAIANTNTVILDGINGILVSKDVGSLTWNFSGANLQWYAAASSGTPALIGDAGSPETVTLAQGAGITTAISGNTVTITAIDQSASNELQDLLYSGAAGGPVTLDISLSASDVTFTAGTNITFNRVGSNLTINSTAVASSYYFDIGVNGGSYTTISEAEQVSINGAGINVTSIVGNVITITGTEVDGSTSNELQNLTLTGAGPTYTVDLSSGTDVTVTQGNGIVLVRNVNDLNISAVDQSATNEAQTWTGSGTTSYTGTLNQISGQGGGTFTLLAGNGITINHSSPNVTITAADISNTNEVQSWTNAGTNSYTGTLTQVLGNGGGSFTMTTDPGIAIVHSAGLVTFSVVDQTVTNEQDNLTFTASGSSPITLNIDNSQAGTGGTDVQFIAGSNITLSSNGTSMTINAAASADAQNLSLTGLGPIYNLNISGGTGTTFTQGSGITLTRTGNDLSIAVIPQTFSHSGTGELLSTLSQSGGSINIKAGTNITVTRSGTGADGIATIASIDNYATSLTYSNVTSILTIARSGGLPDLSATVMDHDWYKVSTTVPPTNSEDGFRMGKTGIGMNPVYLLDVSQDSRFYGHQVGRGGGNLITNFRAGIDALQNNTTGYGSTAVGSYSLSNNKSGYWNTAIGFESMLLCDSCYDNTAIGYQVLKNLVRGQQNVSIGHLSTSSSVNARGNVAVGDLTLLSDSQPFENVAIGQYSMEAGDLWFGNVAIGFRSLSNYSGGALNTYNAVIGYEAGFAGASYSNSDYNVGMGYRVFYNLTSGSDYNIAIGYSVGTGLNGDNNYLFGRSNTVTGNVNDNVVIGYNQTVTSAGNVIITNGAGTLALKMLSSGFVGIGEVTPTQKLHVPGNIRVTGAYYDSNNDPGSADQILGTFVTGTDWIYVNSIISGCQNCVTFINPVDTTGQVTDPVFFFQYDEGVGVLNVPAINLTQTNPGNVATQLYIAANGDERVFASSIESNTGSWTFNANLFYHNVQSSTTNLNIPSGIDIPVTHYIINEGSTFTLTALGGETINGGASVSYGITDKLILLSHDGAGGWSATRLTGAAGTGTVTSIGILPPSEGIDVTNSPVTGAGDITLTLADDLNAVEGLTTNGIAVRTASNTWATRTLVAGAGISITNADGVSGNITIENTFASTSWNLNGFDDIYPATNIGDGETVAFSGSNGISVGLAGSGSNTMVVDGSRLQWNLSATNGGSTLIGNSGGSETVLFAQGSGIQVSLSGNTVTIQNTAPDVVQNLSFSGASSPYDLNISNGGTGVRLIAGTNITLSRTGNDLTINGAASALTGSGMANYVTKWSGTSSLTTSLIQDNGSTVSIAGVPDASYQFKVASGNMKLGDASAGSLNKLYFGDGTFVYVGEDAADDRLYLKGTTMAVNIGGSTGTANYVLTANGLGTTSWQPITVNLTLTGSPGGPFAIDNPNSVNDIRIFQGSGITLTRSGNDLTIAANVAAPDGLDYTGTADLIFLNTTGGSNWVAFSEGSGIQISQTGDNMTIAANDISNTNEAQTLTSSGTTSFTSTLSAANGSGGGMFTIAAGANITISRTGDQATINAPFAAPTNLSYTIGSNTVNTSTGTLHATISGFGSLINIFAGLGDKDGQTGTADQILVSTGTSFVDWKSLTAGAGISITGLTISATDNSATNEAQTWTNSGTTTWTGTLGTAGGSGGGSFTVQSTSGLTISRSVDVITINAIDASNTNEAQTLSAGGTTSPTISLNAISGQGGGTVTFSAGSNVTLEQLGGVITINSVAGSEDITNEGKLTVQAGASNTSLIRSNTSTQTDVTIQATGIITISETPASNLIVLSASEADGDPANEIQTLTNSGTTTFTSTLSGGGGSFTIQGSGGLTVTRSGNTAILGGTFSEVDGDITNEGSLTVAAGAVNTSIINSNTYGQTGVTIQASGIITISETPLSNLIVLSASEADGSPTNESQTLSAGGTTNPTINLTSAGGAGGGTITMSSANAFLGLSQSGGVITFTAANQTNQLSLTGSTSSAIVINNDLGNDATINLGTGVSFNTGTNTLNVAATNLSVVDNGAYVTVTSSTGTDFYINENTGYTLLADGLNLTFTLADNSATNEAQTLSHGGGGSSYTGVLSAVSGSGGGAFTLQGGSGITLSHNLSGTVIFNAVDASATNESQTFTNSGSTTWTGTLSTAGGAGGGQFTVSASGTVSISRVGDNITINGTGVNGTSLTNNYIPKYESSGNTFVNSIMHWDVNGFIVVTPTYSNFGLVVDGASYTGIRMDDELGTGLIGYNNGTFTIGCGSCHTTITGTKTMFVNGGTVIGSNYVNATPATNGLTVEGSVIIGSSGAASQPLHVVGNARFTGAIFDGNNQAGTAGQFLSTTGGIIDWVDLPVEYWNLGTNNINFTGIVTGENVSFDGAGIIVTSRSGNNIIITGTEADGSQSNEGLLTTSAGSSTSTVFTSNTNSSASSFTINAGSNLIISSETTGANGQTTLALNSFTSLTTGMTASQVLFIGADGTPETSPNMTFSTASAKLTLASAAPLQFSFYSGGNSCTGCVLYLDGSGNVAASGGALIEANSFLGDYKLYGADNNVNVYVPLYVNRSNGYLTINNNTQSFSTSSTIPSNVIYAYATSGGITINLGTAEPGRAVYLSNASNTSAITVVPPSGTINGQASISISLYKGGMFYCVTPTSWLYFGG